MTGVITSLLCFSVFERTSYDRGRDALGHDLPECPQISIIRVDGPLLFASVDGVEWVVEN